MRLLGCQTAVTEAGRRTVRMLAQVLRLPVYGRVVHNPEATLEVRTPFAGTLRVDPDHSWPTPGRQVQAGLAHGVSALYPQLP